ncbi:MAG: Rieske 2Fe-2S domain-containing protein [Dehalococcoidia bacterium]|nr:Rieske 2Fe-2S domain-containing protein [Dehalococcoidia bacterium]
MSNVPNRVIGRPRSRSDRWQAEFPYDWEADAAVSRRQLLRLAVLTSGALFAGTLVLAVLGRRDDRRRGDPKPIEGAASLPSGEALYFEYPGNGDQAVLLNLPGTGLVAYSQKCTHLACSVYFDAEKRELLCPCHDGKFDARTGDAIAGPPQRRLPRIVLESRDGQVYAMEEIP